MHDVTGANRLHVRRRGVAAITAAITALGFVVCSLLAMHHEASTAHARSAVGGYRHVRALAGHHLGNDSDIHAQRDPESDGGDCALLTTFHQAASARISAPNLASISVALATVDSASPHVEPVAIAVYRLAPKTSPPASV
jgi:hypothetical protein